MRTNEDYLRISEKLCNGNSVTLWCECGTKSEKKQAFEEDADSDSDILASKPSDKNAPLLKKRMQAYKRYSRN